MKRTASNASTTELQSQSSRAGSIPAQPHRARQGTRSNLPLGHRHKRMNECAAQDNCQGGHASLAPWAAASRR
eukprot:8433498-Pyramimonas_sp.AAC.1